VSAADLANAARVAVRSASDAVRARTTAFCDAKVGNTNALAMAAGLHPSKVSAFKTGKVSFGPQRLSAIALAIDALEAQAAAQAREVIANSPTDELEALAKAALEELRHRGTALAIPGDRAHIADALNACERLAASARAVEQIARVKPANDT